MKFEELRDKKILILGFGREGQETFECMRKLFPEKMLWIADQSPVLSVRGTRVKLRIGKNYLKGIDEFDVIIKTPGIPLLPEIEKVKGRLVSATQLFFDNIDESNKVIGITGSKGKSTVATLIFKVLERTGEETVLLGNIGKPALGSVNKKNTVFIYELSSYQLEDLESHIDIAVVTSFFPDHLDYHGSTRKYFNAKANIVKYQTKKDFLVYNRKHRELGNLKTRGKKIAYGSRSALWYDKGYFYKKTKKLFGINVVKLRGKHNLDNILSVLAVADILKISPVITRGVISKFRGLEHRLERVGKFRGIEFFNDALSTTPESTLAAIDVFKDRVGSIILGGQDRGYDFKILVKTLLKYKIENFILFPDSGKQIKKLLKGRGGFEILETENMEDAVRFCYRVTPKGKVCLLSTASPSYGVFKNFKEKGDLFKKYIKVLGNSL